MLGRAESIGYYSDLFTLMNKKNKVYRKKAGAVAAPHMDVFSAPLRAEPAALAAVAGPHEDTRLVLGDANRIIMERYAPPSVLVDQHFNVVQFNGQTGHYLEPSPGQPTFDILKLAREGLAHGLRTALPGGAQDAEARQPSQGCACGTAANGRRSMSKSFP